MVIYCVALDNRCVKDSQIQYFEVSVQTCAHAPQNTMSSLWMKQTALDSSSLLEMIQESMGIPVQSTSYFNVTDKHISHCSEQTQRRQMRSHRSASGKKEDMSLLLSELIRLINHESLCILPCLCVVQIRTWSKEWSSCSLVF